MILKGSLLQRHVAAEPVGAAAYIRVDETALWKIDIIGIESRRDGEEPLWGLKGRVAMIEFKTQQEIFPKNGLLITAKEVKTTRAFGTDPTGDRKRMEFS